MKLQLELESITKFLYFFLYPPCQSWQRPLKSSFHTFWYYAQMTLVVKLFTGGNEQAA
jgi:hypothetical protein